MPDQGLISVLDSGDLTRKAIRFFASRLFHLRAKFQEISHGKWPLLFLSPKRDRNHTLSTCPWLSSFLDVLSTWMILANRGWWPWCWDYNQPVCQSMMQAWKRTLKTRNPTCQTSVIHLKNWQVWTVGHELRREKAITCEKSAEPGSSMEPK